MRHDVGMGEIDLHQHAVDERQSQRDQDVEVAQDDAVDRLLQNDRHRDRSVSSISAPSTERSGRVSM